MTTQILFHKNRIASCCLLLAVLISACGKPAPDSPQGGSPAKPASQSSPTPELADMDVSVAAVRILNTAHRNGGVNPRGEGGPRGLQGPHTMTAQVTLENPAKAVLEINGEDQK